MSVIGRVATPEFIAAWATAGAMMVIKRGSNGLGIRYSRAEKPTSWPG
jgi:hypothetical protein